MNRQHDLKSEFYARERTAHRGRLWRVALTSTGVLGLALGLAHLIGTLPNAAPRTGTVSQDDPAVGPNNRVPSPYSPVALGKPPQRTSQWPSAPPASPSVEEDAVSATSALPSKGSRGSAQSASTPSDHERKDATAGSDAGHGPPDSPPEPVASGKSVNETGAATPRSDADNGPPPESVTSGKSVNETGAVTAERSAAASALPVPDIAPAALPSPHSQGGLTSEEERTLLNRADALLRQGQIINARLWLDHATQAGSPIATFRLAETYDPRVLGQWRALGIAGDRGRARDLYARALDRGYEAARERLPGLN
jgi:hypothetical protein